MSAAPLAGLGALGLLGAVALMMSGDDDETPAKGPTVPAKATPPATPPATSPPSSKPVHPGMPAHTFGGGRAFVQSLDEPPTTKREAALFAAVKDRFIRPITWLPIDLSGDGHKLLAFVSDDALAVGTPTDSVRFATTILTAQAIADELGAFLPTKRIVDASYAQADTRLKPHTQTPDSKMAHTSRFLKHSDAIELERAGRGGLVRDVGKSYVLTNLLLGDAFVKEQGKMLPGAQRTAIYGWHTSPSSPLQPLTAAAHPAIHTDYSQLVTLVAPMVLLDGEEIPFATVATDPQLGKLINDGASPLKLTRHPGVPPLIA